MMKNTDPDKESENKNKSIFSRISDKSEELFGTVFTVGLILIFTLVGTVPIVEYLISENWITIDGYVTHYTIESDDEGFTRPVVEYRFYVDAREYNGNNYAFGANIYTNIRSSRRYEVGEQVSVHYNPSDPNSNVLNREVDVGALFFLVFPILIVGGLIFGKVSKV